MKFYKKFEEKSQKVKKKLSQNYFHIIRNELRT